MGRLAEGVSEGLEGGLSEGSLSERSFLCRLLLTPLAFPSSPFSPFLRLLPSHLDVAILSVFPDSALSRLPELSCNLHYPFRDDSFSPSSVLSPFCVTPSILYNMSY